MEEHHSRRTFIRRGIAACALCASSAGFTTVLERPERKSSLLRGQPVPPQKPVATVAALQWMQGHQGNAAAASEPDLLAQLRSIAEQTGTLDLVVVGRRGGYLDDMGFESLAPLKEFGRQVKCHLVLPTRTAHMFHVLNPFGETLSILCETGAKIPTAIGTLAISDKSQAASKNTLPDDQEVDINILYEAPGYDRDRLTANAAESMAYTIVVTSPQTCETKQVMTGTALYSPTGSALTETGARWNQAIVGEFRLGAWRSIRLED